MNFKVYSEDGIVDNYEHDINPFYAMVIDARHEDGQYPSQIPGKIPLPLFLEQQDVDNNVLSQDNYVPVEAFLLEVERVFGARFAGLYRW